MGYRSSVQLQALTTHTRNRQARDQERTKLRESLSQAKSKTKPSKQADDKLWLTPAEAAEVVGLSADTLREWIAKGKLPATNVSKNKGRKTWRIRRVDLDDAMVSQTKPIPTKRVKRAIRKFV